MVIRLYRQLTSASDVPRHMAVQMLRAGTAIGANLEEAKSATSRRELTAKNAIALREARECRDWLRLVRADQPHLSVELARLIDECNQIIAILASAVRTLRTAQPRP